MGSFAVDTVDLAGIEWSPDDSAIVIWDSPLEYKVSSSRPSFNFKFPIILYIFQWLYAFFFSHHVE